MASSQLVTDSKKNKKTIKQKSFYQHPSVGNKNNSNIEFYTNSAVFDVTHRHNFCLFVA